MNLNVALPWIVLFVVVLGIYIYVRSRRTSKKK
jgi:hypothetical protein